MKNFSLFFALLLLPFYTMSQADFISDSLPFPQGWEGTWAGKLQIFTGKGLAQTIDMSLEINKIDTSTTGRYIWGMTYVSKDKDWRPYELVPINPTLGLWEIDEKNGIKMESYLFNRKLLCWFTVEGSRILCTYELTAADEIVFEVMSGREKAVSISGNTVYHEETIPEVQTFPFSSFQRGVLRRVR